jgi:hypothetical protein
MDLRRIAGIDPDLNICVPLMPAWGPGVADRPLPHCGHSGGLGEGFEPGPLRLGRPRPER